MFVCMCGGHTGVSAKMAEPIECRLEKQTYETTY